MKPIRFHASRAQQPHKSRGAVSQVEGRFEKHARETWDDGWARDEEPLPPLETTVTDERARSIIATNESPDIPFDRSINPYRGCEHGCVYCMAGNTRILMGDGSTRPLAELKAGDVIYGTRREGWYRRYVKSRVLAHWSVIKQAYRITLEDGTQLVAGGDHRFLTERGWKFVTDQERGNGQRPHLTTNNKLMGVGGFAETVAKDRGYRLGYLCGIIRGDGALASYRYERKGRKNGDQHRFRLALCDGEALARAKGYLREFEVETDEFVFQRATAGRRAMRAIRTSARLDVEQVRTLIAWPEESSREWSAGFLAGIFDAEGSYSQGALRIPNTDREIIERISRSLQGFGFRVALEHIHRTETKPIDVVRLMGGVREHLRFFHTVDPAISRKRTIEGVAVKSDARLGVVNVEPIGKAMRLYDITTETEDFIANGVVSHNCYARQTHAYLELSPGLDFETKLFAKRNAAELLKEELAKPSYRPQPIAFGTNTDAYQPIERRYRIMRELLEVLAACEHPLTVVTKSALVERDLDLLAPMAAKNLVKVFVSVNTLDHELARRLEPRAASPNRRIATLRALAQSGVPCGVMVAPMIPALTDKSIEEVLAAAAAAGATMAGYIMLRLPFEVKPLFKEWLATHYPLRAEHVMNVVRDVRGGRENDPNFTTRMSGGGNYAQIINQRFAIACRKHGLNEERRGHAELDCTRFRPPAAGKQMRLF
ncbi:MAG: PA0069 family radical SAM protein [Betaproteobacteria bacterium]|nr:PA0069 family radical SAM protein [Betaproteobacteria bacterium]